LLPIDAVVVSGVNGERKEGWTMSTDAPRTYQGDWIDLDEVDRGKAEEEREPVDHHKYWDRALHSARGKVPPGEEGPFRVERYVRMKHHSPGWVDGYRIDLSG
jgi:hypothetical protein